MLLLLQHLLLPLLLLRLTSESSNDSVSEALQLSKDECHLRALQPTKFVAAYTSSSSYNTEKAVAAAEATAATVAAAAVASAADATLTNAAISQQL